MKNKQTTIHLPKGARHVLGTRGVGSGVYPEGAWHLLGFGAVGSGKELGTF